MPLIQNVSKSDIESGDHMPVQAGDGTVLIQISDPDCRHPMPLGNFSHIFGFKFLDIEDASPCVDPLWRPTASDARCLASILAWAFTEGKNVVVHCHAGICRSGAVAEAGEILGFEYAGSYKQPNATLKRLILNALGIGFNPEDCAFLSTGTAPEASVAK